MIFCPSCAARIDAPVLNGENIICPVCGTEFTSSDVNSPNNETRSTIVDPSPAEYSSDSSPAPRRQTTEEILLERLRNEPPQNNPLPWKTLAIVIAAIFVVSYGVFLIASKPDVYKPGHPVDSSMILQKRAFFQHIVDSVRNEIAMSPANIDLHLALADDLYDAGSWTESVNEFQTYLAAKPDDTDARVDYAIAITQASGDINLALSEIDSTLTKHPENINALFNGGIISAQSINDSNHVVALARAKNYFTRAKTIAEKTNPSMALRFDTLIQEIDATGKRMAK